MTPSVFWRNLMTAIMDFIRGINLNVYLPLMNTIKSNPILLLIFAFMLLGFVINIFKRMIL